MSTAFLKIAFIPRTCLSALIRSPVDFYVTRAAIHPYRLLSRMRLNFFIRRDTACEFAELTPLLRDSVLKPHRVKVLLFLNPSNQILDLEHPSLLQNEKIQCEVMTVLGIVEHGVNSVTKVLQDMVECFTVCIDEHRSINVCGCGHWV